MPLSIFSFDGFVKKSIIISTVLFFFYNILVLFVDFPVKPGHQWQDNIITAEDYIYEQNDKKTVIVGSSLSSLLIDSLLPEDGYNLSFAGQSAFDGLEIIKETGFMPDIVLIETNAIFKSADKDFQYGLFMPVRYSLKKIFPALMEKNQPVCFLNSAIFRSLSSLKKILVSGSENAKQENMKLNDMTGTGNSKTDPPVKNDVKNLMIDIFIKNYSQAPHDNVLAKQKKALTHYKEYLVKKGIEIILFEMPIDPRLTKSKMMESARTMIRDVFPPEQYVFLQPPNCSQVSTMDGIHLDQNSASQYTSFLADKINNYAAKKERTTL